jgi:hypothetical protein
VQAIAVVPVVLSRRAVSTCNEEDLATVIRDCGVRSDEVGAMGSQSPVCRRRRKRRNIDTDS